MSDSKITNIVVKSKTRHEMTTNLASYILKDKELLVETDGENETFVARFKIGDGKTPYSQLPYISNLYKLCPNFLLYNNDYTFGVNIILRNEMSD